MKSSRWNSFLLTLFPLAVGMALRLYQLPAQIIADDEFHALNTAIRHSYRFILTHFGEADHSIPVSLFYKVCLDIFWLDEMVMRGPMVLAGLASLVVFPRLARGHLNQAATSAFRWLLAISPLCIYFSRYARPYALTLFLTFTGLLACYEWGRKGRLSAAVIYVLCAILASYLHLASAPILLAALLYWLIRSLVIDKDRSRAVQHFQVLLCVSAGLALTIGPPLLLSRGLVLKLGRGTPDLLTLEGTLELFCGVGTLWIALPMAALVLIEVVFLLFLRRRWIHYLLFVVAFQILFTLAAQPVWVHVPIVLTRYLVVLLPVLLILLAAAIGRAEDWLTSRVQLYPQGLTTIGLVVLLLSAGPLPATYYHPNNWTNHAIFQYSYAASHPYSINRLLQPAEMPAFYRKLGQEEPGSITIVEAPWYYQWGINNLPYYQRVHGQHTRIGFIDPSPHPTRLGELPLDRTGLEFRNFVHLADRGGLREGGVQFAILHKDLQEEIKRVPVTEVLEEPDVSSWIEKYRDWFGDPVYEDALIVVFAVLP